MSATYNNRLIAHPTSRLGKKQKNDNQLGGESRNTTSTESLLDVPETIEETNIRKNALRTLENYEELVWTAMARNEVNIQCFSHSPNSFSPSYREYAGSASAVLLSLSPLIDVRFAALVGLSDTPPFRGSAGWSSFGGSIQCRMAD